MRQQIRCNIVNGRDVMRAFKISSGPLIGTILKEVTVWEQKKNYHVTKNMAYEFIRNNIVLKETDNAHE